MVVDFHPIKHTHPSVFPTQTLLKKKLVPFNSIIKKINPTYCHALHQYCEIFSTFLRKHFSKYSSVIIIIIFTINRLNPVNLTQNPIVYQRTPKDGQFKCDIVDNMFNIIAKLVVVLLKGWRGKKKKKTSFHISCREGGNHYSRCCFNDQPSNRRGVVNRSWSMNATGCRVSCYLGRNRKMMLVKLIPPPHAIVEDMDRHVNAWRLCPVTRDAVLLIFLLIITFNAANEEIGVV